MREGDYEALIPEGDEVENGKVILDHGTSYSIALRNRSEQMCDAIVHIDGKMVGVWRIDPQSGIRIHRPVTDTGKFTFYTLGSPEAMDAAIADNHQTGIVSIQIKPERRKVYRAESMELRGAVPRCAESEKRGGTGLSGFSNQEFSEAAPITYDSPDTFVTITLILLGS